jgi:pimeloyl-ACP methyl ester carboxylesterase
MLVAARRCGLDVRSVPDHGGANMQEQPDPLVTVHHFVPHVSTVPVNAGQVVGLYVREKILASVARSGVPKDAASRVVLFVHGGFSPSAVAYDLDYKDYSWMAYLARAGFDVFAMTHQAYGASPKPTMDDPCNVDPEQQHLLIPYVLKAPCAPRYPFKLVSSQTEWDEVATVVKHLTRLRGVNKVSMVGWSTGAPRIGGFAAQHPELVDRIVFLAPSPFFESDDPPSQFPEPGAPMILQTRERLEGERWLADVKCPGQIDDPSVKDIMWKALMAEDGLGATWIPGGVMRAPNRMNYGWRRNVASIGAPTLVMLGEFDNFERRLDTWNGLRVEHKAFIKIACGSHFLIYEKNRRLVHEASREWLLRGTVADGRHGFLTADAEGNIR